MSKQKDEIRSAFFSSSAFKRETVEVFGVSIDVRQAPLGRVLDLQGMFAEDRKVAISRALMEFCVVPGTNEAVFDEADAESILAMPFGEDFQELQDKINKIMGVKEEDVKAAEGNLEETTSATTSS